MLLCIIIRQSQLYLFSHLLTAIAKEEYYCLKFPRDIHRAISFSRDCVQTILRSKFFSEYIKTGEASSDMLLISIRF